jgi:hypothetical protein
MQGRGDANMRARKGRRTTTDVTTEVSPTPPIPEVSKGGIEERYLERT